MNIKPWLILNTALNVGGSYEVRLVFCSSILSSARDIDFGSRSDVKHGTNFREYLFFKSRKMAKHS